MILGSGVSFSKDLAVAEAVISRAFDNEITTFDTAPSYGTEELLGRIIHKQCKIRGVSRNAVKLQTKIDAWQMQGIEGRSIADYVGDALVKLQTDYIDSLLIHWPVPEYVENTWKQMEKLKKAGIVCKIGICNVRIRHLKQFMDYKLDIVQIERHPLMVFGEEVAFCNEHGIEIQAYSPLCKMDERIKESEIIKQIGQKYGKSQGQTVLRWHLDSGVIPIFTTSKTERVVEYSSIDDFALMKKEIESINGMNENYKMYLESVTCPGF